MLNLLDGLRDLKAPLASGLILMFGIWLIFANEIADLPRDASLSGNFIRLSEFLTPPGTLGLLAFTAYLLGLVLSLQTAAVKFAQRFLSSKMDVQTIPFETGLRLKDHIEDRIEAARAACRKSDVELYKLIHSPRQLSGYRDTMKRLRTQQTPSDSRSSAGNEPNLAELIEEQIIGDMDLLAVQLHSSQDKVFDKFEKNKSEGDFRAAILFPLLLVVSVVVVRLGLQGQGWVVFPAGLAVVLLILRLLTAAFGRFQEANEAVLSALILGNIKSAHLARLDEVTKEYMGKDSSSTGPATLSSAT